VGHAIWVNKEIDWYHNLEENGAGGILIIIIKKNKFICKDVICCRKYL